MREQDHYKYLRLCGRVVRLERLWIVNVPAPIVNTEIDLIGRSLDEITPVAEKLKKYIESELILSYRRQTKGASCFTCDNVFHCEEINADEVPKPLYHNNADKACVNYKQHSLSESMDAKLLHPLLAQLNKKYGIDKDRVLNNI